MKVGEGAGGGVGVVKLTVLPSKSPALLGLKN